MRLPVAQSGTYYDLEQHYDSGAALASLSAPCRSAKGYKGRPVVTRTSSFLPANSGLVARPFVLSLRRSGNPELEALAAMKLHLDGNGVRVSRVLVFKRFQALF